MPRNLRLAACAASAVAPMAFAQTQEGPADSWAGQEIIVIGERQSFAAPVAVTATRTPTPIEEIPQSVQVLTRTLIEEQDLQTLSDALANVSGIVPAKSFETLTADPIVRGFASGAYIDGLPVYALTAVGEPTTLINVERIEVAKGPTATLFSGGSGAPLSGVINVVSRDPGRQLGGSVAVRAGSFDTVGAEAELDAPLAGGTLLFRIAADYERADSYIDVVESDRWALYPTLVWNASDATKLTLRGQVGALEQLEYSGLPASIALGPQGQLVDRFTFAGAENAPKSRIENTLLTAVLDHRFNATWSGAIAARRYESRFEEFATTPFGFGPDAPVGPATAFDFVTAFLPTDVTQTFVSVSALGRFATGPARHQVLLGADRDETDYDASLGFGPLGVIDVADRRTNLDWSLPATSDAQADRLKTQALFAQDQIALGDRLDVTLGLRWTRLEIETLYTSGGLAVVDLTSTEERVTPRIGATFQLLEGLSAFAGYAEGFQGLVAPVGVEAPKPEESRSYEAGLKFAAPLPGLTGTLALYEITRENVITGDPANPFGSIQTGEQRAQGFEIDVVYEPGPALSLLATYGNADVEVTRDTTLPVGDRPARVPEHAARLAGRYRVQAESLRGLEFGAGVTHTGERELTLPNAVQADALTVVDAQAAYAVGPASLSVSVVNLFDADAFEPYAYLDRGRVIPTQPRSAFVTLKTAF